MNPMQLRRSRSRFLREWENTGKPISVDLFKDWCEATGMKKEDIVTFFRYLRWHGDVICNEEKREIRMGDYCTKFARERTVDNDSVGNLPTLNGGHTGVRMFLCNLAHGR